MKVKCHRRCTTEHNRQHPTGRELRIRFKIGIDFRLGYLRYLSALISRNVAMVLGRNQEEIWGWNPPDYATLNT